MGEHDFESEVLERLASIETEIRKVSSLEVEMKEVRDMVITANQSARSAHHRINGMYLIGGAIAGIISFFINLLLKN
ncbi:hypothetical protein [Megasphaera sp.]|jgi:hypothetical protein|uniref:hypothetical protein n=1 Tax=Megasphaera sp. TaxID=2023260 RepID=UPI00205054A3|nr:MAG TPA: hemolysin [Caudoviricetes sp.]